MGMGLGLGLGLGIVSRQFAAGGYGDDFVFTVETTISSESFTIPCFDDGIFNAVIDWGDGTAVSSGLVVPLGGGFIVRGTHTYSVYGKLTVTVLVQDVGGSQTIFETPAYITFVGVPVLSDAMLGLLVLVLSAIALLTLRRQRFGGS